jgi:hypothetical protein
MALAGTRLRYVVSWFGLPMVAVPDGLTKRQVAARRNWAYRREVYGQSGLTERGLRVANQNLRIAQWVKRKIPKADKCSAGHRWTPATTRQSGKGRVCRLCEVLARARRQRSKIEAQRMGRALVEARTYMIEVGIRANREPDSAYWRARYEAAIARWQKLKRAA